VLGFEHCRIGALDTRDPDFLRREPALLRQIVGIDVAEQGRRLAAFGNRPHPIAHDERHELGQRFGHGLVPMRHHLLIRQKKPVEAVSVERQQVGQVADRRKVRAAEQLDRDAAPEAREIKFDGLRGTRQVDDAQDRLALVFPEVGENLAVAGIQEVERAAAEGLVHAPRSDHAAHPVQQRRRAALLGLDVDRSEAVDRVHDRGEVEARGVRARKAAVPVRGPLHRRADAVPIAKEDVVAHADLVAVIDDRRARHGQQQAVHQLDLGAVVFQQRCQPATDSQVDAGSPVHSIEVPEIVALLVRNHFERQLVMVAEKDRPLAVLGNLGRLAHDVGDRMPVFLRDRHVHARHQREMERHVAFVSLAEVLLRVLGPLVRFGEQHPIRMLGVKLGPEGLQDRVRLAQILVVRSLALDEVGHGVEAHAVDAHVEPEVHHVDDRAKHGRIVEVQVGLVRIEAVPIVGLGHRIPRPVGRLRVQENNARLGVLLIRVAPDVEVAVIGSGRRITRSLEPRMLVRRVVHHQFGDDSQAAYVGFADQAPQVPHRAVARVDVAIVGDVVTVVA